MVLTHSYKHRIETGFSYKLSLIHNSAFYNIFSLSFLVRLKRPLPLEVFRVTMMTFLRILEVVVMVSLQRHFYRDSLRDNTRGSGK